MQEARHSLCLPGLLEIWIGAVRGVRAGIVAGKYRGELKLDRPLTSCIFHNQRSVNRNRCSIPRGEAREIADFFSCSQVGPSSLDDAALIDDCSTGRLVFAPGEINSNEFQLPRPPAGDL